MPKYAKIGHKGPNKQKTKQKKNQTKQKNKTNQQKKKTKISRDCRHWGHVFGFFVFFLFFFVFLFFPAPREGCRELSLFMPQGKDAES